jgi:hypothetical protein
MGAARFWQRILQGMHENAGGETRVGFQKGEAAMSCICNLICLAKERGIGEPCLRQIKVYRVRRPDCGLQHCVYRTWGEVENEFDGADNGDMIHVEMMMMTEGEFQSLPDFEGW